MTDRDGRNAPAQFRATLDRFAGLGQVSRGRAPLDALTQDEDDINVRVTDIGQAGADTNVYDDAQELMRCLETPSAIRIITIYSESTIEPLQVTPDLMDQIMSKYDIDHAFLHVIASFGDAPDLTESTCSNASIRAGGIGTSTTAYEIRYPEENLRKGTSNPWSFRHTGVYHHQTPGHHLFVVLQPRTDNPWEARLLGPEQLVEIERVQEDPFSFHELLFSSYLENWRWYLRYLSDRFSKVNDIAMVIQVDRSEAMSSFSRVQNLRNLKDFALFTRSCCRSNLEVLQGLLDLPQCGSSTDIRGEANRMRGYAESADVMQGHIKNSIDLVWYTLTLHNQLETAKVDNELRDLTRELKKLTQDTVDDSITVKIITFVSAFYIPGSFVGTMFGMNFFVFDATEKRIVIAHDFWIFIAAWLPLTLLTAGFYLLVVWLDARWNKKEPRWPWKIKRRPSSPA